MRIPDAWIENNMEFTTLPNCLLIGTCIWRIPVYKALNAEYFLASDNSAYDPNRKFVLCVKSSTLCKLNLDERFEVFTEVPMKNAVFWDMAPCRSYVNRRFGGMYRFRLQGRRTRQRGTSLSRWFQTEPPVEKTRHDPIPPLIRSLLCLYVYNRGGPHSAAISYLLCFPFD
jgi:hypothetical protein